MRSVNKHHLELTALDNVSQVSEYLPIKFKDQDPGQMTGKILDAVTRQQLVSGRGAVCAWALWVFFRWMLFVGVYAATEKLLCCRCQCWLRRFRIALNG